MEVVQKKKGYDPRFGIFFPETERTVRVHFVAIGVGYLQDEMPGYTAFVREDQNGEQINGRAEKFKATERGITEPDAAEMAAETLADALKGELIPNW